MVVDISQLPAYASLPSVLPFLSRASPSIRKLLGPSAFPSLIKIKLVLPTPPPPETQNILPPKSRILWRWRFSSRKNQKMPYAHKIAQPFLAMELQAKQLRTLGFFSRISLIKKGVEVQPVNVGGGLSKTTCFYIAFRAPPPSLRGYGLSRFLGFVDFPG